ncbi:hypothetical protein ANO14919_125810 [Xylariales sp. No.14919]|nr:hypothetical protein ANO14919_125810 [Xylariales sp. No.14919]
MPLAPVASSQAKQTIQLAFQSLEKTISPADSRQFASTSLQDVRAAAIKLEEQLSARRCLRNMRRLEPFFKGLGHYANAVGVLCNGTPYLAWIWAPITLILSIASDYVEAFEKLINAYSRIAESLKRFEFLNSAYASDKDFQQTLAAFYSDILQFHQHAYRFITRNGWKLLFPTLWGRFQRRFDDTLENLARHERLVDKEANARNIAEARQMRQEIRDWRQDNLDRIERLEKDETSKQYLSIASWLKVDDSEQQHIYDSLHSEGQSYPGTCAWALKNKSVQLFLQKKSAPQVLWLRGVAGSGKSVLSAELINFAGSAGYNTARFFCSRSHRSNSYDQIIRSLFLQMLRKDSDLIAYVYRESVLSKVPPSSTTIERLFHKALMTLLKPAAQEDYIWIFIDGVNECDVQTQTRIADLINLVTSNLIRSNGIICKVFVSSRALEVLSRKIRRKDQLSLTEEKSSLSEAIMQYTSQRLQELHVKLEQLSLTEREIADIHQSIVRKSDGMFLYARLILDYLANNIFIRGSQIVSAVNDLPKELSEFYQQILSQILAHLNPQSVGHVRTMFQWIAFARRSLKRVEFLSAMAFSEGDYSITTVAPRFILEACNTLVEERADTTLSFIHSSVHEFLESADSVLPITEMSAVEEQGIATITCLLSGLHTFSQPPHYTERNVQVAKGLHALHIYATEYWTDYLLCSVESAHSNGLSSRLRELVNNLSKRLDELAIPDQDEVVDKALLLDSRLQLLGDYPLIQKQASIAIYARSLKYLQARSNQLALGLEPAYGQPGAIEQGLEALLSSYQQTIIFLLGRDEYPGVSPKELEEFKINFRTSAYTCRFASCPRATLGFESKEAFTEHEKAHLRRWACTVSGCQYPPFDSAKSLQAHSRTHHSNTPRRRPIRKTLRPSDWDVGESNIQRHNDPGQRENHANQLIEGRDNTAQAQASAHESAAIETQSPSSQQNAYVNNEQTKIPVDLLGFITASVELFWYKPSGWGAAMATHTSAENVWKLANIHFSVSTPLDTGGGIYKTISEMVKHERILLEKATDFHDYSVLIEAYHKRLTELRSSMTHYSALKADYKKALAFAFYHTMAHNTATETLTLNENPSAYSKESNLRIFVLNKFEPGVFASPNWRAGMSIHDRIGNVLRLIVASFPASYPLNVSSRAYEVADEMLDFERHIFIDKEDFDSYTKAIDQEVDSRKATLRKAGDPKAQEREVSQSPQRDIPNARDETTREDDLKWWLTYQPQWEPPRFGD